MAEKVYNALADKDLTRWELSKVIDANMRNTLHAIDSATYNYPDIYEYDVKRGNGTKVIIGRLCNYNGKK